MFRQLHLSYARGQWSVHKTLTPECLDGYEGSFQALLGDPLTDFRVEVTARGTRLVRSNHSGLYYEVSPSPSVLQLRRELQASRPPQTLEELLS